MEIPKILRNNNFSCRNSRRGGKEDGMAKCERCGATFDYEGKR